ncbi:UDP-N-acetylmuramoyl-L-alanine--D-glutamate ligase [Aquimarina sp. ERC-38]|uniref:UDP-N-acetylmuramoyl-L-alanine--D-glutamate ligase n=1 Tax=Aquimarina sp. ERC-38 TaxID=2949996 RepID=UPI0022465D80|nr:UDP-N-acetylmuramoyl-L-alanine--D-glutamate ligase [Aquimarina sp. ERC-38]UZO82514.1 UDP-N-acetylmuramoyl-L-alanine--D-glutamate ligase [Aquimarina sp. ERC-38]
MSINRSLHTNITPVTSAGKLVVLGAGISGTGAALLAKQKGYNVWVSDASGIAEVEKHKLKQAGIAWEENGHTLSKILDADVVIKSPGIPDTVALIRKIEEKNIRIIDEIEFASQLTEATLIAITGSNGKTTTTMLTYHILKNAGFKVKMAGNIGISFAEQVYQEDAEYYVLEISSFQLDRIQKFAPHIAVITNISPDHLDRYNYEFDKYIASKFNITVNQSGNDYFIFDTDDPNITNHLENNKTKAQKIPFSLHKELDKGAYVQDNHITLNIDHNKISMPREALSLKGNHNVKNAMAAATVSQLLKIRKTTIRESLESFQGVEHRLEDVLRINNVRYINDSKATNVNAVQYALETMKAPTIWLVGGVDKGNDYTSLYPLVNEKVKAIICIGIDNQKIIESFKNCMDTILETQSMKEAVRMAYGLAERNDNVLLSPACSSFDLYNGYEERGRQFKEAIREL